MVTSHRRYFNDMLSVVYFRFHFRFLTVISVVLAYASVLMRIYKVRCIVQAIIRLGYLVSPANHVDNRFISIL